MNTLQRAEQLAAERHLSLNQLTRLSDVNYSTLSSARRRGTQLSVDTIERLCVGLAIPLAEFFRDPRTGKDPE